MDLTALLQNPMVLVLVVAFLFLRGSEAANPLFETLFKLIRTVFNVPDAAAAKAQHAHDLDTTEGLVCAVDCLSEKLKAAGSAPVADNLLASLPGLIRNSRAKVSAKVSA